MQKKLFHIWLTQVNGSWQWKHLAFHELLDGKFKIRYDS